VAQAGHTAEQVAAEARARAQVEYERIVANADAEVNLARQRAVDEAAGRWASSSWTWWAHHRREVDAEAHRDLIDEAIGALQVGSRTDGSATSGAGSLQ